MFKETFTRKSLVPVLGTLVAGTLLIAPIGIAIGDDDTAEPSDGKRPTGHFTIASEKHPEAAYKAYFLFSADMIASDEAPAADNEEGGDLKSAENNADDTGDTDNKTDESGNENKSSSKDVAGSWGAHINWASDEAKEAVLSFIDENGYTEWLEENNHVSEGAHDLPQNALEFVCEQIGASADDEVAATVPPTKAAYTFATELARHLGAEMKTFDEVKVGEEYANEQGYYLFATDTQSLLEGTAGTAAIWVPLGGSVELVDEKTGVPTIEKQVKENSTGEWGLAADANRFEDVDFKITGTISQNIGAFDIYSYSFEDEMEEGMELSGTAADVKVSIDGIDVTSSITGEKGSITYKDRLLKVEIPDLLTLDDKAEITSESVVLVEYKAHLDEKAPTGGEGVDNETFLIYTGEPVFDGKVNSVKKKTTVYTYKMIIEKQDEKDGTPLSGARFTVQRQDSGEYVQQDGSLGDTTYEFESDASGLITVDGIDANTYVLHEVKAPDTFKVREDDIVVEVTRELDQDTRKLESWEVAVSGGAAQAPGIVSWTRLDESKTDIESGTIYVITSDAFDDSGLADILTMMTGTGDIRGIGAIVAIAGALIAIIAVMATKKRSRK